MENKKNTILLTVIAVATLLVAVVGATFAYFTATGGAAASKQVNVITGTAASSSFAIDGAINIYADATNFAENQPNRTGSSNGTVTFTAPTQPEGSTPLEAKDLQFCYSVSLNITGNDFVYTTEAETPELTLDVTKDTTSVVTAMDITTKKENIQIPTEAGKTTYIHKITATPGQTVTEKWKTTVTLVNLDSDQNKNTGKNLAGVLQFTHVDCTTGTEIK